MGADGFVGGFCNRGCNFGTIFESRLAPFCVGTKTIDEVPALVEAPDPPPEERLRLGCSFAFAANGFAASGTGGGGILFWEGLLDSADDDDDEEPRRLGESVVHDRVDRSAARLTSPSSTSIESEVSLVSSGILEPDPDELDAVPEPEAAWDVAFTFAFTVAFCISRPLTLARAFPLSNTTRPLFACPWDAPSDVEFLPSLACRARFLVAVVVVVATAAAAATVFAMDVLPTRVEEDEEDATKPAIEFRHGCPNTRFLIDMCLHHV
jgi:hypothetical protein